MVSREDCPGVGRTLNIRTSVLIRDGKGENREAQGGLEGGNWNFATKTRGMPGAPRAGNRTGGGGGPLEPPDEAQPHEH